MNIVLVFVMILGLIPDIHSQTVDTVTMIHYNLLQYGSSGSCPAVSDKDGYLNTLTDYEKPDIFTVNELNASSTLAERILTNVLNDGGNTAYDRADLYDNSSLANMLYFDSTLFKLESQDQISTDTNGNSLTRLIDVYKLYYDNDPNLSSTNDTTFLYVLVAHLKAGSSNSDQNKRDRATAAAMDYLDSKNIRSNILFAGDFNVKRASEQGFQNLISSTNKFIEFNDPVNAVGDWSNNGSYSDYHTQSTRTSSSGCHSTGGMDDRFDFILANDHVMNDSARIKYMPGSYWAIAQDGNRLNENLVTNPSNNSVPSSVLTALHSNSDHLPVKLDMRITFSALPPKIVVDSYGKIDCDNNTIQLDASSSSPSSIKYSWEGDSIVNSNPDSSIIQVADSGDYKLIIIDTLRNRTEDTIINVQLDTSSPTASIDQPICSGSCDTSVVELNASNSSPYSDLSFNWVGGTILESNSDSSIIKVSDSTDYTLTIIDTTNGCTDDSSVFVPVITYIGKNSINNEEYELKYNNPFKNSTNINIKGLGDQKILKLSIHDIYGRKVFDKKMYKNNYDSFNYILDGDKIEKGVYIMHIYNDNGVSINKKLIKF
ncbi:MAG: T9SS type A sorting domain-containing protein [Flavobacteriales bacterium]